MSGIDIAERHRLDVANGYRDYVKISGQCAGVTAEEAFNLFVQRWVEPKWHAHLADSDDNEAEFVRRFIRGELPE